MVFRNNRTWLPSSGVLFFDPLTRLVSQLPQLWQPRFYDFNVYSHEKKNEKLDYMHANPVKRGGVRHPKDWPWSSWLFYSKKEPGPVPIDTVNL
jgi:hypothetical protein